MNHLIFSIYIDGMLLHVALSVRVKSCTNISYKTVVPEKVKMVALISDETFSDELNNPSI